MASSPVFVALELKKCMSVWAYFLVLQSLVLLFQEGKTKVLPAMSDCALVSFVSTSLH